MVNVRTKCSFYHIYAIILKQNLSFHLSQPTFLCSKKIHFFLMTNQNITLQTLHISHCSPPDVYVDGYMLFIILLRKLTKLHLIFDNEDVHLILLWRLSEGVKVVDEETEPMLVARRKLKTRCLTFGVSGMRSVYFCTDETCHTVVDCERRVVATGLRQRLLETTGLHLSFRQNFSLFVVWNAMGNTESREASFWSTANIYPNNFHCNVSSCVCKMW